MSENENSKSRSKLLEENRQKIRIEQYIRCYTDISHYDNGVWQIASINTTIAGIMTGVSFQFLSGSWRAIPLFIAFCLSLALTVTMSKYLYFQLGRAEFMHIIEVEFNAESVPTSTEEISEFLKGKKKFDMPASWFKSQKAHQWLIAMMLLVTFLLLILTFVSPFIL